MIGRRLEQIAIAGPLDARDQMLAFHRGTFPARTDVLDPAKAAVGQRLAENVDLLLDRAPQRVLRRRRHHGRAKSVKRAKRSEVGLTSMRGEK